MVAQRVFVPLGDQANALFDDTRSWVDPNGYQLSDRLWRARLADRKAIDDILRRGLMTGADPLQVAKDLETYLMPAAQLVRFPEGHKRAGQIKPLSQQPKGVATRSPRSGLGNYAARRLTRTETSRAFNESVRRSAEANPFVFGVKWNLSGSHKDDDECDSHARGSSRGFPPGVYRPNDAPTMPNHPHCRCFWTQVTLDADTVVAQLRREIGPAPSAIVRQPTPRSSVFQGVVSLFRAAKALLTREAA